MKRLSAVLILLALTMTYAGAQIVTERCWHLDKVQFLQHKQDFWRSHKLFSTSAQPFSLMSGGYYNLTEAHYGYGLKLRDVPFSHHFFGITTVNGMQFGSLALGVGVGYFGYNEGWLLPLYADGRYYIGDQKNKFFIMLSSGFLLNFKDFPNESNFFANPGGGIMIPLTKGTRLSFAVGFFTQFDKDAISNRDAGYRDSFVNMKLGLNFGK